MLDRLRRYVRVRPGAADAALAGLPDDQILAWAAERHRCLVTENVEDFEILRRQCVAQGISDPGLLYSGPRRFPRDRRFLGALVAALDQLLTAKQVPGPDEVSWLLPL